MEANTYFFYLYKSPFGAMTIRPDVDGRPAWFLTYETFSRASSGEIIVQPVVLDLGWRTAEKAAEAVRSQTTGWKLWDSLPYVIHPAALDDWTQIETTGTTQPHR
ncbi:hypothetical protein B0G76_1316 [Paraburkholderia sp. BL23I1N1]|uniref:hypothetical protein n=1 Tax=Paraburkholderia sp. BL23I1N1 TaxID=1938802 RepID=UPI000E71AB65|nr:hypothetical protein [Paraburkholderia sp. BL23I1N1]RKE35255.1 hypothetical protein B0G76_1316 [Paraburkholderia sp. BL23I1N1]